MKFTVVVLIVRGWLPGGICSSCHTSSDYLCQQVLGFPSQSVRELPAPRRQVEDGCGCHVGCLHVVGVVEAALTAGAAGTAPSASTSSRTAATTSSSSTAHAAAAAGSVAAGGATGWARRFAVALSCVEASTFSFVREARWRLVKVCSGWILKEDLKLSNVKCVSKKRDRWRESRSDKTEWVVSFY